jgi:hypothetical protein
MGRASASRARCVTDAGRRIRGTRRTFDSCFVIRLPLSGGSYSRRNEPAEPLTVGVFPREKLQAEAHLTLPANDRTGHPDCGLVVEEEQMKPEMLPYSADICDCTPHRGTETLSRCPSPLNVARSNTIGPLVFSRGLDLLWLQADGTAFSFSCDPEESNVPRIPQVRQSE